jgi:hypothetical protein
LATNRHALTMSMKFGWTCVQRAFGRRCQVLFIEARDVKVVKSQWSTQHFGLANLPQKHQSRRKGLERVRLWTCHCSFTAFAVRELRTVHPCQESPSETLWTHLVIAELTGHMNFARAGKYVCMPIPVRNYVCAEYTGRSVSPRSKMKSGASGISPACP